MLPTSTASITKFRNLAQRAIDRTKKREIIQADRAATALNTVEVSAVSFLFGLGQGKLGGVEILGVSVDLIAGLAFHIGGFMNVGGKKLNHHMHAVGDGALASYFNGLGRNVGYGLQTDADRQRIAQTATKRKKQYATLPSGAYSFGMSGETGGAGLADEELARMVAAGRR